MNVKEQSSNLVLNTLNEKAEKELVINFGYHEPKGAKSLAYFYTYLETEQKAKDVAAWLVRQRFDSEIYYVEAKKQFIVKIPFANTYILDHFNTIEVTPAVTTMINMLADATKNAGHEWTANITKLSKIIFSLNMALHRKRNIRKGDLNQTTLFAFGVNYANSDILDMAVKPIEDLSSLVTQIESIIKNIAVFDREKLNLSRCMHPRFKKISQKKADETRLKFAKDWLSCLNKFFRIVTTNIASYVEVLNIDNDLYTQWLFINRQLKATETGFPKEIVQKWLDIKAKCIAAAAKSRKKLEETPCALYQEDVNHYIKNFMECELILGLEHDDYDLLIKERAKAERKVEQNEADIKSLKELYASLKTEITALAHETFSHQKGSKPENSVNKSYV